MYEIVLNDYISYKKNSITRIHKMRKKFSFKKGSYTYNIVYDRYKDSFKKFSVITVTSDSQHAMKDFSINDIVECPTEKCSLAGLDLVHYLAKK